MNRLAEELIRGILGEEMAPRKETVGMFAGGFKPPTTGHLEVVQKALNDYPEMDKMIIYVGSGERDSIDQKESVAIWRIYQKYLPSKVEIQPSPEGKPPIGAVYSYAKNNPDKDILWFLGEREGNKDDFYDFLKRVRALNRGQEKGIYPNLQAKKIITPSTVSGTKARKALLARNKEEFFSYLPDIPETEEIWNMLSEAAGIMEDQNPIEPNYKLLAKKGAHVFHNGKKMFLKRRKFYEVKGIIEDRYTLEDKQGRQYWISKADMGNKWTQYDPEELKKGIEVEKEHTDNPRIAMKIALDHLDEDPKYYSKLATLGLEEGFIKDLTAKIKSSSKEQVQFFKELKPLLKKWRAKDLTPEEENNLKVLLKDLLKVLGIAVTYPVLGITVNALLSLLVKKLSKGKYTGLMPSKIAQALQEYLDKEDVEDLDDLADKELNPIDVDLSGNHFFDRLNDPRNRPEIDYLELEDFFTKLGDNRDKFIDFLNKYKSVVATDNQTNINIPFMKMANKAIAKTIMRKRNFKTPNVKVELEEADPKKGTGKKPKGSGRRLYTDEDPSDTVKVKFSTRQDIIDTLSKKSFKSKSHARQSQVINLIHQRVRAAYGRAKKPEVKKRLKIALDYITKRKEASKAKTKRLQAQKKKSKNEALYEGIGSNLASYIQSLTDYMSDNGLNLKPYPELEYIETDEENAENILGKTAYYMPSEQKVVLYTLDRHPKDILRSYAHELIHHHQNLNGTLNHSNTTNTNEDDDLDAIEREAYENGNILFRNWEDSLKN